MATPPPPAAKQARNRPSGWSRARLDEMAAALPPLARANRLLSVPEAAAYLALSIRQMWVQINAGRLPSVRVAPRSVRIHPDDLRGYINQRRSNSGEAS